MANVVAGTANDEVLTGSEGADVFVFVEGHGNDTIADFEPGTDVVDLSCFGQEISWDELSARISTVADPDDPNTVTGVVIDLTGWGGGTITLDGVTSVDDIAESSFRMPAVTVTEGTDGYDLLVGGSGMDRMYGGGTGDILDAGAGNDELHGGEGQDLLLGGAGDDKLFGDEGNDTLDGGTGRDELHGGAGNDTLDGAAGVDTLVGGLGDDTLWGDRCAVEKSTDTFVFGVNHGADTIKDFADGQDRIDLSAFQDIDAFSDLSATQDGDDVVIDLTGRNGGTITLENVDLADLDDGDFVFHDTSSGVDGI